MCYTNLLKASLVSLHVFTTYVQSRFCDTNICVFCLISFSSIKHSFLKVSLDLSASYLVVSDVIKKVRI